jgi:hypothetical protein
LIFSKAGSNDKMIPVIAARARKEKKIPPT